MIQWRWGAMFPQMHSCYLMQQSNRKQHKFSILQLSPLRQQGCIWGSSQFFCNIALFTKHLLVPSSLTGVKRHQQYAVRDGRGDGVLTTLIFSKVYKIHTHRHTHIVLPQTCIFLCLLNVSYAFPTRTDFMLNIYFISFLK